MENWDKVKKHDLSLHWLTNAGNELRSSRDARRHSSRPRQPNAARLSVVPEGWAGFGGGAALRGGV